MYLEKDKTRAQTRANLKNKKLKCRNYWCWFDPNGDQEEHKRKVAKAARTPAACSCFMCGNPRKYWGTVSFNEEKFLSRNDIENYFKHGE